MSRWLRGLGTCRGGITIHLHMAGRVTLGAVVINPNDFSADINACLGILAYCVSRAGSRSCSGFVVG